jgi:hypothetical protein
MADYMRQACHVYSDKTGLSLKAVDSPFAPDLPEAQLQKLLAEPGRFQQHSASVLMKLLYGARMAAPWLSVPIQRLARQVHRWTAECDRRLHRLYCYVHSSIEQVLKGTLSTADFDVVHIDFWADADLAGDLFSTKSTSGRFVELVGKEGRSMPLHWGSKQQSSTQRHTQGAETVALATGLAEDGLSLQQLVSTILRKPIPMIVREDNNATILAIKKGYSPSLRALPRTERVSLGALHEFFHEQDAHDCRHGTLELVHHEGTEHKADIFTKEMPPKAFNDKLGLMGVGTRRKASASRFRARLGRQCGVCWGSVPQVMVMRWQPLVGMGPRLAAIS